MADWGMGTYGTGRLEVWENWNSSTQVSLHYKLQAYTGNAWNYGPGPTWNGNMAGGYVGSGAWSYTNNKGWQTLRELDVTFNKDANGNLGVSIYGYINGDNSPYVTSGSASWTHYPARIGVAPTIASCTATNVGVTTATINMNATDFGLGTSVTQRMFYKKTTDASWTQVSDQTGTGAKSWNLTGLQPATSYHILARAVNNNGDTGNLPSSYPSGSYMFTTLPAPANSRTMMNILGIA